MVGKYDGHTPGPWHLVRATRFGAPAYESESGPDIGYNDVQDVVLLLSDEQHEQDYLDPETYRNVTTLATLDADHPIVVAVVGRAALLAEAARLREALEETVHAIAALREPHDKGWRVGDWPIRLHQAEVASDHARAALAEGEA